jgi:hypothetical protein
LGGQNSLKTAAPELVLETVPHPKLGDPLPGSPKPRSSKSMGLYKKSKRQNNKEDG